MKAVDINKVLEQIIAQNPQIILSRIELFTQVYYPIATLEMELEETTFENFDVIPLTILRFIDAGLYDAVIVAKMMGLSKNYVRKMFDLLRGYGYLDESGLTEIGHMSLEAEQKIAQNTVRQKFQADAVTGDLLRLEQQVEEGNLELKDKTVYGIAHLPHIEGIEVEDLNNMLKSADLTTYKRYKGDILNSNVVAISDVKCVGMDYVKAYLLKMQGIKTPFIITNQYDSTKENFAERFSWKPIRVPSRNAYTDYGFDEGIPCYTEEALLVINDLYKLVCKRIVDVTDEDVRKTLSEIYPFNYDKMDISIGRIQNGVPEQISVYVNAASFTEWNMFILKFLEGFDMVSGYVYTHGRLNGLFLRFESANNLIKMSAKEFQRLLKISDRKQLMEFLRKQVLQRKRDEEVFDFNELIKLLKSFSDEKNNNQED